MASIMASMQRQNSILTKEIRKVPAEQKERYDDISRKFESKYGKKPSVFTRAPGRVNLIGEHIDYCGYAVLPMALEQDVVMAMAVDESSNHLTLSNTDPNYSDYTCPLTEVLTFQATQPAWHHYVLCGVRGILESHGTEAQSARLIKSTGGTGGPGGAGTRGVQVLVSGNIPPGKGLSSSSALVCCAALLTTHILDLQLTKLALAEICAKCERYIGTQGGGMDQAIAFLAQRGTAKLIEFNPIQATDVRLPEGAAFVISDSVTSKEKATSSDFNVRVVETRLAAKVLSSALCVAPASSSGSGVSVPTLSDVQHAVGVTSEEMLERVLDHVHTEPYTRPELLTLLRVTDQQLDQHILTPNTRHVEEFRLYERACHVYGEANRVAQFKILCADKPHNVLTSLGELMNESHSSCRDLYECSCAELDELTDVCRASGALGSRLTGAGWGGCAVSLVPASKVTDFILKVRDAYYNADDTRLAVVKSSLFATQPGEGAAIYEP